MPNTCSCFLKLQSKCYCTGDVSVRYSIKDGKGFIHGKRQTPNEALKYGRERLGRNFSIYDNLEKKTFLRYE